MEEPVKKVTKVKKKKKKSNSTLNFFV